MVSGSVTYRQLSDKDETEKTPQKHKHTSQLLLEEFDEIEEIKHQQIQTEKFEKLCSTQDGKCKNDELGARIV